MLRAEAGFDCCVNEYGEVNAEGRLWLLAGVGRVEDLVVNAPEKTRVVLSFLGIVSFEGCTIGGGLGRETPKISLISSSSSLLSNLVSSSFDSSFFHHQIETRVHHVFGICVNVEKLLEISVPH